MYPVLWLKPSDKRTVVSFLFFHSHRKATWCQGKHQVLVLSLLLDPHVFEKKENHELLFASLSVSVHGKTEFLSLLRNVIIMTLIQEGYMTKEQCKG